MQTILLVEDEDGIRSRVREELIEAGFNVLEADTGEAALEILRLFDGTIDWLFTDIRLPGQIDGWHVAFEYRFHHPLRPVVYATGFAPSEERRVENSILLRKPYRIAQAVETFEELRAALMEAQSVRSGMDVCKPEVVLAR